MKINISDFSSGLREDKSDKLKAPNTAKSIENFDVSRGSIKKISAVEVFGGSEFDGIHQLIKNTPEFLSGQVFFYHRFDHVQNKYNDMLVLFDSAFKGYYIPLENPELRDLGVKFSSAPTVLNYRLNGEDVLIMASASDHMVVWNGVDNPEIILDAPKIKSMDIHYERLFAVSSGEDDTYLKFSDDLDPTNWSESLDDAGFISLVDERGKLLKVLSFNDYLYVFRERGITRVYANTSLQSSFYVNHLFTAGGRILEKTLTLLGDRVIFLATDGFYIFDGADTHRVLERVFPKIKVTGNESATFFDGKYYLSCTIGEGEKPNALLVVEVDTMNVSIIAGITPTSMTVINGTNGLELVIFNEDDNFPRLLSIKEAQSRGVPITLDGVYVSAPYDFGEPIREKTLTKITLTQKSATPVEIIVTSDFGECVDVVASKTHEEFRCLVSGREFEVQLKSSDNHTEILSLGMEARVRDY